MKLAMHIEQSITKCNYFSEDASIVSCDAIWFRSSGVAFFEVANVTVIEAI